jgi:hypothetical protein
MKSKEKVAINQLTLKEIIKDLFESSTDIESRLFRTVYGLTVKPDKVIFGYVQDQRDQYTSAFRYLLFSVFVSFISFTYFFAPQDVGGAYYLSVKNNILDRLSSRGADILFVEENFNIFYTEFIRMVTLSYKFAVCFNIPPILLVSVIFLRGIGLGIPSLFVASLFLAAHSSLLSSLFITPLMYFTDNIFWSVYGSYFVSFVYSFFGFWRLRGHIHAQICKAADPSRRFFREVRLGASTPKKLPPTTFLFADDLFGHFGGIGDVRHRIEHPIRF